MKVLLISVFTSLIIGFVAGFLVQGNLSHSVEDEEIIIPTGYEQKKAVGEDVEQQEVLIEEEYQKLLDELSVTPEDSHSFINSRNEAVSEALVRYHEVFPIYRDAACDIDALQLYGGTGSGGVFLGCVSQTNEEYLEKLELIKALYSNDSISTATDENISDIENKVTATVTMLESRTYGRVFLEDVNQNSGHHYILAEPTEVIIDGGLRYSLMTRDMMVGEKYEVSGSISQSCFDYHPVEEGVDACIAWMDLQSVVKLE